MKTTVAKILFMLGTILIGVIIARAEPRKIVISRGKTYDLNSEKEFDRFQKMDREEIRKLPKRVRDHYLRKLHRKYIRTLQEKNPDKKSEIIAMKELLGMKKGTKRTAKESKKAAIPDQFKDLKTSHTNKIGDTKIRLEAK